MKGRVLDFSIQTNVGVISGDDGSRYSFTGGSWQLPTPPQVGVRVDFNPEGNTATGIYADTGVAASSPSAGAPASASPRGVFPAPVPAGASPSYPHPGFAQPAPAPGYRSRSSTLGMFGMIIGLPALILFWIPILGWLLMVAGLGLSVAGLVVAKQRGEPAGFAIAGTVLNSLTLGIRTFIAMLVMIYANFISGVLERFLEEIFGDFFPFLSFLL